jgi:hypothetical protein
LAGCLSPLALSSSLWIRRCFGYEKIGVIREELADLATQTRNKTSEISWLEKKCGVDNSVAHKIAVELTPGPRAAAVKQGIGIAGGKVAEKSKMLWGGLRAGASSLVGKAKAKIAASKDKGSGDDGVGTASGVASPGKDKEGKVDMYSRYA